MAFGRVSPAPLHDLAHGASIVHMPPTEERCKGCGKVLNAESAYVLVEQVAPKGSGRGPRPKQAWGKMHRVCFARMTRKPQDLLEVLGERERTVLAKSA